MADSASSTEDLRQEVKHRTQQSPLASQRAKGQPPNGNLPADAQKRGYFPLSYKDGLSQWWAAISPAAAEHKVLSFVPYLKQAPTQMQTSTVAPRTPLTDMQSEDDASTGVDVTRETSREEDPYGPRRWHSTLVKLSGKNRAINEFSVERLGEEVENNLVMLHGYGAGLGFFYKNFEPLSRVPHWRLYALDLLGMGRSSRPPFRVNAKDRQGKINESENWFVDSLEEWRKEKKIERFTLLGHSMGGYMAVCYALKYPGRLNKLILASPVGLPEDPYAVNEDLPEPGASTMQAEVTEDQSVTTGKDRNNFLNKGANNSEAGQAAEPKKRPYPKWLVYLWDANVSPFSLVRWSGPFGPRLVSGWTSRRFSQMPPEESQAMHDYAYSLFRQRGSGEYALAHILAPGAFARSPLIRRIAEVGRQNYTNAQGEQVRERGLPVVFMYGDHDWMDVAGGYASADKLRQRQKTETKGMSKDEAAKDQGTARVYEVKEAGHHLYLDNWEQFSGMIHKEMKDTEKRERDWLSWFGGSGSSSSK